MWSDADAFYKTQLQVRRILLTEIPMFHVKHQTPSGSHNDRRKNDAAHKLIINRVSRETTKLP